MSIRPSSATRDDFPKKLARARDYCCSNADADLQQNDPSYTLSCVRLLSKNLLHDTAGHNKVDTAQVDDLQ